MLFFMVFSSVVSQWIIYRYDKKDHPISRPSHIPDARGAAMTNPKITMVPTGKQAHLEGQPEALFDARQEAVQE